ncbi:Phosphatidylinositol-4-phosphate 5-kinase family protein [Trifolium repens]|nr:Phosphatidylinositol-4-phosphate 5-kinase family protein [Trifolium repens]
MSNTKNEQSLATVNMLRDRVSKATLGAVADLGKNGVLFGDKISDTPFRRQGVLAGRIFLLQLSLGCLTLPEGCAYDGMWRYGKRSGLGFFYFNNAERYQGSWRDDMMHGKGWLYFQSGDRCLQTFGDIFFGHFKDGWQNGEFLHVSVDGTRFREVWDEGTVVTRMELDPDASDPGIG